MTYDVFISYSSHDQKNVEEICTFLEARGIKCFVAFRDIPRGVVWARAIVEALDQSRMMVVAFSEHFNRSEQVDREIELASEDRKPILTFRLNDTKFEGAKKYYLKNLNWIDAFPAREVALEDLYVNICKLLGIETQGASTAVSNSGAMPNPSESFSSQSHEKPLNTENLPSETQTQNTGSSKTVGKNSLESELEFDLARGEFKKKSEQDKNRGKGKPSKVEESGNVINGHEYVDLGLPSGLKWATCNIGASSPEEYGDYFAWGEIKTKSSFTQQNSETFNRSINWLRDKGYVNEEGVLTPLHDAATQLWGGSWRIPTDSEVDELLENTTFKTVTRNKVKGRLITSNINGNSIFLPAAGWKENMITNSEKKGGNFWCSNCDEEDYEDAYYFFFDARYLSWSFFNRCYGYSLRPVSN